ncbi:MAG TPA: hypothetical protein VE127_06285 [Solirubrobacteraceae bacterium]|nr:hypothetical protein [Solirubrobacteraceae bacterium]
MRIWFHIIVALAGAHLHRLGRTEWAIRHQVDTQVERYYPDAASAFSQPPSTPIAFGRDGIPVFVTGNLAAVHRTCHSALFVGCHSFAYVNGRRVPWIVVYGGDLWSIALDHEIIETLGDPWDNGVELCDPVEGETYVWHGVYLSNFIKPSGRAAMR